MSISMQASPGDSSVRKAVTLTPETPQRPTQIVTPDRPTKRAKRQAEFAESPDNQKAPFRRRLTPEILDEFNRQQEDMFKTPDRLRAPSRSPPITRQDNDDDGDDRHKITRMCILFPTEKLDFWMRLDVLAATSQRPCRRI